MHCANNLKQLFSYQMAFADDNDRKVYAHNLRSRWMIETQYRPEKANDTDFVEVNFYPNGEQMMEPYLGKEDGSDSSTFKDIYRCPDTQYDPDSYTAGVSAGRTYNGFMDYFYTKPSKVDKVSIRNYGGPLIFEHSTRKPFMSDYITWFSALGTSKIHNNNDKLNLLVTDGSVIKYSLPTGVWDDKRMNATWVPYFESALGVSAY
ncbi:hypothetical protein LNTAR_09856 [Lentisphaera araneosa HTCC2155]|uniref:Uncharacterized protein n=1 Tax=Lentisphaera araneosa HTCC2155 TaxID=313628 RepID=A6DSI4_9BACT|nr:hypothetical protein LNTAR_09856 [Lentisphaera araneosa HTCC2155]